MAHCIAITLAVNMPAHTALTHSASPLHYFAPLVYVQMAFFRENSFGSCAFCSPSLVRSDCPDLQWSSSTFVCASCFQQPPLHSEAMPRLWRRMRCRRGASRGHPPRPRSSLSPTLGSSAEDDCRSLQSESRRQRRHFLYFGGSSSVLLELHHSLVPPPPFTPVMHEPASPTLCQTSQHKEFRFNCTFDKPVLTAIVTISVCESSASLGPATVPLSATIPPRPQHSQVDSDAPDLNVPLGIRKPISESDKVQEGFFNKDSAPLQDNAEKEEEFGCRIVEEPDSPIPNQ